MAFSDLQLEIFYLQKGFRPPSIGSSSHVETSFDLAPEFLTSGLNQYDLSQRGNSINFERVEYLQFEVKKSI